MTTFTPAYRARLYKRRSQDATETTVMTPAAGAAHAEAFQVASVQGLTGYRPYLEVVRGRKGRIDPLEKKADTGTLTLRVGDPRVVDDNQVRWLTAFLGDAAGIEQLRGARMLVEEALDYDAAAGTGTWAGFFAGRVETAEQDGQLAWRLTLRDVRDDMDSEIFTSAPHALATTAALANVWPMGLHIAFGDHPVTGDITGSIRSPVASWRDPSGSALRIVDFTDASVDGRWYGSYMESLRPWDNDARDACRLEVGGSLYEIVQWEYSDTPLVPSVLKSVTFRQLAGGAALPAPGSSAACRIVLNMAPPGNRPVSHEVPILIGDVHPVTLFRWILLGYFALDDTGTPRLPIAYNVASFAALEADATFPLQRFVVEGKAKLSEWIEKSICQPNALAYRVNGAGEVEVIDLRRPASLPAGIQTITASDLVAQPQRSSLGGSRATAVTQVDVELVADASVTSKELIDTKQRGPVNLPCTGLVSNKFAGVRVIPGGAAAGRATDVKPKTIAIEGTGFRYRYAAANAMPEASSSGLTRLAQLTAWGTRIAGELRGPYTAGASYIQLMGGRTAAMQALTPGALAILSIDALPNAATNTRGGSRLVRVISIEEEGPQLRVQALDLGESGVAVAPTFGSVAKSLARPYDAIDVTVNCNASGEFVQLDAVVVAIGAARPADTDAGWYAVGGYKVSATQTWSPFPSGSRVYFRARTEPSASKGWKLPSAYVYSASIDMTTLSAPTGLAMENIHRHDARFTWTPADPAALLEIFLSLASGGTIASDLFNRADNAASLGSADTGQAWAVSSGTFGVQTNRAYRSGGAGDAYAVVDAGVADCTISYTLVTPAQFSWCPFRYVDASNFWMVEAGSAGANYKLYKRVGGTFTLMDTSAVTIAANDVITVRLSGTSIAVDINGNTDELTATDSAHQSATKHGLGTNGTAVPRWDNFSIAGGVAGSIDEADVVVVLPAGSTHWTFYGLDGPAVAHIAGVRHRELNGGVSAIASIGFSTTSDTVPVCPPPNGFHFVTPDGTPVPA